MASAMQELARPATATRLDVAAGKGSFRLSVSATAIFLFVGLCALLPSALDFSYRWWIESQLPEHPKVLLVGSSVIAEPFVCYEYPGNFPITFLEQYPIDRAPRLESALATNHSISVWNASVIGQSIFETVRFVTTSLTMNKRPHVAILFIAPVNVCGGGGNQLMPPPSFLVKMMECGKAEIDRLSDSKTQLHQRLIILAHMALKKSTKDISAEERAKRWADFDYHYAIYYKCAVNQQKLKAISRFLAVCQSRSIKALIVSTPLAPENRALLRGFTYNDYKQAMERVCQGRCRFVDLGESPAFEAPADFLDGAHCNGNGAEKIYGIIAPYVVQLCRE
jgi:hypothetical protein